MLNKFSIALHCLLLALITLNSLLHAVQTGSISYAICSGIGIGAFIAVGVFHIIDKRK